MFEATALFVLLATAPNLALAAEGVDRASEKEAICPHHDEVQALCKDRDEAIAKLEERIAILEEQLALLLTSREDEELALLMAEAEAASADQLALESEAEAQREVFVGRQRSLQALNPEISFLGDISLDLSSDDDIQDRFLLRGAEISFQAPLDPFTRFKGFLAAHQEPPLLHHDEHDEHDEHGDDDGDEHEEDGAHAHSDEITVALEEAYLEWVALPGNMRLRVGKFRQQFGTLNRWHPHSLASVDVPFALRNTFGHEGLVGLGVGADWQLPGIWATSNGLTVEIVNASNELAFAGSEFDDPAYLLRHTGFFDLGPDTYLDIGINGMIGPGDASGEHDNWVASLDFNFLWEPAQRARYRNFEVRGEFIHTSYDDPLNGTITSDSFYAYLSAKLGRRWSAGIRFDDAELPWPGVELYEGAHFEEGLGERALSPFLTFWQSEFVRMRLQYQHATRDFAWQFGPESDDRIWLQVTFAAGPHKHESY